MGALSPLLRVRELHRCFGEQNLYPNGKHLAHSQSNLSPGSLFFYLACPLRGSPAASGGKEALGDGADYLGEHGSLSCNQGPSRPSVSEDNYG